MSGGNENSCVVPRNVIEKEMCSGVAEDIIMNVVG